MGEIFGVDFGQPQNVGVGNAAVDAIQTFCEPLLGNSRGAVLYL